MVEQNSCNRVWMIYSLKHVLSSALQKNILTHILEYGTQENKIALN
jgi:hypothetical protein